MIGWEHQFIIRLLVKTINYSYDNCSYNVMVIIYTYFAVPLFRAIWEVTRNLLGVPAKQLEHACAHSSIFHCQGVRERKMLIVNLVLIHFKVGSKVTSHELTTVTPKPALFSCDSNSNKKAFQ